jgi:hypothetical protein
VSEIIKNISINHVKILQEERFNTKKSIGVSYKFAKDLVSRLLKKIN